jgi:hypothetical protein
MSSLEDLKPLADQNLADVVFKGNTPEERMLTGFVLAKQYMQPMIPSGHVVDLGAAMSAQEGYEQQISDRKEIVRACLADRVDLPENAALSQEAPKSREYWLSTYAFAVEGIGAYATGYGRQQVGYGLLSERDYTDSIDLRTKSFANIVSAGKKGQLAALMSPSAYYQNVVQQSPSAKTMQTAGQLLPISGGRVVLTGSANKVFALDTTKQLVPVQLGFTGIEIAGIVVLISAIAIGAYVVRGSVEKERIRASAEFMGRMCSEAVSANHASTIAACTEYADKISTPTPAPFGLDNLSKYLAWGAVGLAAMWMLPTLMARFEHGRR